MLQDLRAKAQGVGFKIIIGLIVVSFAGFGIQSILLDGGGNEVAVVNGEKISPQQLQLSIQNQKRRMMAMLGDNLDPAMLDDERLAPSSLEALINRRLLMQSAESMGLAVSNRELSAVVASMEQFQVDGAFSPDMYKALISEFGFTPNSFKLNLGEDLVMNQVSGGLAGSEFVTPSELQLNAEIISEQRDFRYLTIPRENFSSVPAPGDQQVQDYYEARLDDFRTPESVDVDYIDLGIDTFRAPVGEQALLDAYEVAKQDLQYQTQNRVSHILFDAGGDDVGQRIASAQQELAAGTPFAEVAQAYSDDVGSAGKGGDLGYSSGETFPQEMEEAIAALEPGVVSDPVETAAGTHLILVTERKAGEVASFEEMRAELEENVQAEEARIELLRVVESLRDITFNADDLDGPAAELNLEVQRQEGVTRVGNEGVFSSTELTEAAFSEEVLTEGHNSDVIEQAGERFVVLRVRSYNEPEVQPLEEVRDGIVAAINAEAVDAAVAAAAEVALNQLRGGSTMEAYAEGEGYELVVELGIDRRNTSVPPDVLRRVFELPPPAEGQASTDYITAFNGDAIVIDLQRVVPGHYNSLAEAEQLQLQRSLTTEFGTLVFQEYQRSLRDGADISVL
jgi:peptidyl-prolyl cis-trans isomerase D